MCLKKIFSWFRSKNDPRETSCSPAPPMMNIEEFVQASIVGIMSGIRSAQKEYAQGNSAFDPLISPAWAPSTSDLGGSSKGHADKIHELEFDLKSRSATLWQNLGSPTGILHSNFHFCNLKSKICRS